MRASDVMSRNILSVMEDATVFDAAELLLNARISAMTVINAKNELVGIVSEADLIRRAEIGTAPHKNWLQRLLSDDASSAADYVRTHSQHVRDVMTRDVVSVDIEAPLGEVAATMSKHNVKRVPVLDNNGVVGMVSRADLLRALLSREKSEGGATKSDDELRRDITKVVEGQPWSSAWPTNVVVSQGVAHLWGFVQSEAARKAYRVAAENVPGVKAVKNHMRMPPSSVNMGV
jgi:CBS-domain-containing membrane protein